MEGILSNIQELLNLPAFLINQCNFLPDYVKSILIACITFIPWLYFLYLAIELLERFFMKHINLLVRLIKRFGPLFGVVISVIPECGYQVIASTFYSRKMISRGTLLAFLISCSDEALPLLMMDLSKAVMIIPLVVIKLIVGVAVAVIVDLIFCFNRGITEDINAINTDLNETACCHHTITTVKNPPYWYMHPITHTFNIFVFSFLSLLFIEMVVRGFGSAENLAEFLMINSPIQVIAVAILGLIPNCVISIFLTFAYIKGIISFSAFLAGMITSAGLGLSALYKRSQNNRDNTLITMVLLMAGIITGIFMFYNEQIIKSIQYVFIN